MNLHIFHISLNDLNNIYIYIGQTVDEFRLRWNNYKSNNRKHQRLEPCMQEHLFEHFNEEGHHGFLEDVSITFIDKTDPSEPFRTLRIIGRMFFKKWRL